MRAIVIIPTFNEGERLIAVVEAAKNCRDVEEVIVVNDGSTDNTAELLNSIESITLLTHTFNKGKGESLDTGMKYAQAAGYDTVVFLDADLWGIEPHHISKMLDPLKHNESYMSIGYLGMRKGVYKLIQYHWGGLSGQRALRVEVWDFLSRKDRHGFNIEAALNARLRKKGLHRTINRVSLDGVGHIGKRIKVGSWPRAINAYFKTYGPAIVTYARIELE